jgi:hypothetical protein
MQTSPRARACHVRSTEQLDLPIDRASVSLSLP